MSSLNNFSVAVFIPPKDATSETVKIKKIDRTTLLNDYIQSLNKLLDEQRNQHLSQINQIEMRHKKEIDLMNKEFKKNIDENVKIAFEDGEKKGISEGKRIREDELKSELIQIQEIFEEISKQKDEILRKSEEDVVRLAISIARKIIQVEPKINPAVLKKVTISALDKIIDKNKISLHIHPDEKNRMIKFLPEFGERFRDLPKIEIVEDSMIPCGGCIIETISGFIDARLETQIQKLSAKLLYTQEKGSK